MNFISILTVLGCVVAGALAAPTDVPPEKLQPTVIPIVSQFDELEPNGTYKFSYETGNGITREETAYEKILPRARGADSGEGGEDDGDDSNEIHVQRGSYSYTAPDGTVISVSYIADENGFQPVGAHLPRSPVFVQGSNSAEKSGRALKLADSSESESAPAKAKVDKIPSQTGNKAPESKDLPVKTSEEIKTVSIPASSTEESKLDSIITPTTTENEVTSTSAITQETKSDTDIPTSESNEAKSLVTEAGLGTTEGATTVAVVSTTDSEATTISVDVSTEPSTAASAQSTTESEQVSTASADQASTSPPESTTDELSEPSSSTSASESANSTEDIGPSTTTETVSQSTAEEAGQSSTNASESPSTEQTISTTTA